MARILICHVPKDGSLARELGASLMGRDHFVSFDGDPDSPRLGRFTRLRQFDAVIVMWTEHSAQSAGLADIARESLPHNLLVALRANEMPITKLPLVFRKITMLSPRDFEGIARVVARMSAAASSLREMAERDAARKSEAPERPAAAKTPAATGATAKTSKVLPPQPRSAKDLSGNVLVQPALERVEPQSNPPSQEQHRSPQRMLTASDLSRAVDDGLLVHRIPPSMWLGAPIYVEIAVNREVLARLMDGQSSGARIDTLSLGLQASRDAFEIERQSDRTQMMGAINNLTVQDAARFGRWIWLITPNAAGPQNLSIRISALVRDATGTPTPVAIPDRRMTIDVQIPEDESLDTLAIG